jgi:lipopolysaccharide heptosyltransferase III
MIPWHKRLEGLGKRFLARVAGLLFRRAGRRDRAAGQLLTASRVLLVRIDDRLGEALLLTPLISSLRRGPRSPAVDVLVHQRTARVLEGHPDVERVLALDRRGLALGPLSPGIRAIRRAGPWDLVVDCGNWEVPSVTSALVSRLVAGPATLIGPAVEPTGSLHDLQIPRLLDTCSELKQRLNLLSALPGVVPVPAVSFRAPRPQAALASLLAELRERPHAVVVPGGRLGWRRIPPQIFAVAARALTSLGRAVIVGWGPGEEELARTVVETVSGARLAPATDLDGLAALLAAAGCTVCNNSGPMHLSVAVGAPTLALFLHMDPERWGYSEPPHRVLDLTPLEGDPDRAAAAVGTAVAGFLGGLRSRAG